MATEIAQWTRRAAETTAKYVVDARRRTPPPSGIRPPPPPGTQAFYAKLVGESASTPGRYSWSVVDRVGDQWVERSPRLFDSSCSAAEMNGAEGVAAGTVALMALAGYVPSGTPTDPSPAPDPAADGDTDVDTASASGSQACYVFAVGQGLPKPGLPRQVLQLDDNKRYVLDYVQTP